MFILSMRPHSKLTMTFREIHSIALFPALERLLEVLWVG